MYKQWLWNHLSCFLQLEDMQGSKFRKPWITCNVYVLSLLLLWQALFATREALHQKEQEVASLRSSQLDSQTLKKKKKKSPMYFQRSTPQLQERHNAWNLVRITMIEVERYLAKGLKVHSFMFFCARIFGLRFRWLCLIAAKDGGCPRVHQQFT